MPVFAANLTMLWPEIGDPYDRLRAAAEAGFALVERLFVHDLDIERTRRLLADLDLRLVLFDPYPGDWGAGERGLLAMPGREAELRDTVHAAIDHATTLGTDRLNVLSGMLPEGVTRDEAVEVASANLAALAPAAREAGITLMVEPINDIDWPGYAIPTVTDALRVITAVGHPAVGLQFDAYHVARAGEDPITVLDGCFEHVRHVQIADVPGRHQPGTGRLDIEAFLDRLDALGYGGAVGLEYLPDGDTEEALAWLSPDRRRG